jgi:hypothetical protein
MRLLLTPPVIDNFGTLTEGVSPLPQSTAGPEFPA